MARDPLEDFLAQINELLDLVNESKTSPEPPAKEIEEKLKVLEGVAQLFSQTNEEALKKMGITEEQIQSAVQDLDMIPEQDKRMLERVDKVKKDVESVQHKLAISETIGKQKKKNIKQAGQGGTARKKKFRRMGGDTKWKPL